MSDDWHFAQRNERQGPVSFERLQRMAQEGWLHPTDLVWHAGLTEWIPATQVEGLFPRTVAGVLRKTWQRFVPGRRKRARRAVASQVAIDWSDLSPRHAVAMLGGFLAALGIAFTAIAHSRLALAITLGGLVLIVFGLSVEFSRVLAQAFDNVGRRLQEVFERRMRAQELALQKQRLDLEVARLAHQEKALARLLRAEPVEAVRSAAAGSPGLESLPAGEMVVLTRPPARLWSPGLAALLSFFVPGLGQLYKGQFLNAVVWFFVVLLGYAALIVPGLLLHFCCVVGALSGNPWAEGDVMIRASPAAHPPRPP